VLGFNYRMTNVAAAIGLGQLEMIDWHIERRREIAGWYAQELSDTEGIRLSPQAEWARSVYWINCMLLAEGGEAERAAFKARVKSLVEDVPDLPNFSSFHDSFRDDPRSGTSEGHMREAFFRAYDEDNCDYVKLNSPQMDERLKNGPPLISANFVIPYPPGFPIMVPGQVITSETITFMRKLDVKEIHGYQAARGVKVLRPDRLAHHYGAATPLRMAAE
jgi:hypothetical protein